MKTLAGQIFILGAKLNHKLRKIVKQIFSFIQSCILSLSKIFVRQILVLGTLLSRKRRKMLKKSFLLLAKIPFLQRISLMLFEHVVVDKWNFKFMRIGPEKCFCTQILLLIFLWLWFSTCYRYYAIILFVS